jgi:nucleoside-diphosphate-sugar epimerase
MAVAKGRSPTVARRARTRAKKQAGSAPPATLSNSPSRYIVKVDRATGAVLDEEIRPEDLLVHAHRDNHPLELLVQFSASRLVDLTRNEKLVKRGVRGLNKLGEFAAEALGALSGSIDVERRTRRLLGVVGRDYVFRFREPSQLSEKELKARIDALQREAKTRLSARGRNPRLKLLLTGATGFLGKEILAQAAGDRRIDEVVCVVRPEPVRDPKTKEVVKVLSPAERGKLLLSRLHVGAAGARKFRFVAGDIEQPNFGLEAGELSELRRTLTHVIHCAASVSFDDSYENSFRANVLGCRNALAFSLSVQRTPGSPFVAHLAIETSYIHGRRKRAIAQEGLLEFPPHFYNNFYELTKAMASIETDRALVADGLRVMQLLPSIVIGDSRTGNNRGDTKVVNAPINAFGRAKEALSGLSSATPADRVKSRVIGWLATSFPADRSAELNLVPVDRVAAGILAALTTPAAIGARIHLATDNRIKSEDILRLTREELGVNVRLADPTLARNVTLPIVKAALTRFGEHRLAGALERLGAIFSVYGEWGQPIHDVGNDVRLLGLPIRRPDTQQAFRMLCRHNKYVQNFGRLKDADEVARRERLWRDVIEAMEFETGRQVGSLSAAEFRRKLEARIDTQAFLARASRGGAERGHA